MTSSVSMPNIDLRLDKKELLAGSLALSSITRNSKTTICLFTYATGERCYTKDWWCKFYKLLKFHFSEYNFVEVLPLENISNLSRKAPTFYSKDIRELASFMANTAVVIAADSGIMHLASSSLTPTIGLFSVTDTNIYSPYNKNSVAIDTNKTSMEGIVSTLQNILTDIQL